MYVPYLYRDFIILLVAFLIFPKALNLELPPKRLAHWAILLTSVLFSTVITFFISKTSLSFMYLFAVLSLLLFARFYYHCNWNLSVVASIISFGVCLATFTFSAAFVSAFVVIFHVNSDVGSNVWVDAVEIICISIIQFSLCFLLFRIKRFKRGMPFLLQHEISDIGVYISIVLLLIVSFVANQDPSHLVMAIFVSAVFFCSMSLPIWWKNSTTKFYIEQIRKRELENYQLALREKEAEVVRLKTENEQFSKIIHKDNKLVPAMEMAVQSLLNATGQMEPAEWTCQAEKMMQRLADMAKERKGIITDYEQSSKKLSSTKSVLLDATLSYMQNEANSLGISFGFAITAPIPFAFWREIEEPDFNTIMADLIENAFHAVDGQELKAVLVQMGSLPNGYVLAVFDSGIYFDSVVLKNFGRKRLTTRSSSGGSGIGLMTLHEIIQKSNASFCIEEFLHISSYTKKVSICFDRKGQFRVVTTRQEELQKNVNRPDIIWGNPEH